MGGSDKKEEEDETDTQKLEKQIMDMRKEKDSEREQLIDVEEDAAVLERPKADKKEKIDLFNDPLLPQDPMEKRRGSGGKKRGRSGSFGNDDRHGGFDDEELDGDEIAFDDLNQEQKYQLLQELYEEYQRDPENFPEEQRILLEQELKELFDQNEFEEEEEEIDDERMKIEGNINFPDDLPARKDEEPEKPENQYQ